MKLSEIYKIADEIAPKSLSDEYCKGFGAYDNSGLLIEADEEIKGILFSLDLTNAAIDDASMTLMHNARSFLYLLFLKLAM